MNVLAYILRAGSLIGVLGPLAMETVLQIKAALELSPDYTVNIHDQAGKAIAADEDAISTINAWRAKHGIPIKPTTIG